MIDLSAHDISLLLRLILSHLIADFLLQTTPLVEDRYENGLKSWWLWAHSFIAGSLAVGFAGLIYWIFVPIFMSHLIIDALKSTKPATIRWFTLDQIAHLIVIFILWIVLVDISIEVSTIFSFLGNGIDFWVYCIAYLIVIFPSGYLVGMATEKMQPNENDGLPNAGKWIGILERVLLLTFVILGEYAAIGLLVTAKSIFRFTEARDVSEYILIGTLISFTIALVVGLGTNWVLLATQGH